MSKVFKGGLGGILGILGLGAPKTPAINIPPAALPIPPAPNAVTDTGASVALGTGDVKNQRVSGRSTARKKTSTVDVLGGLGSSGLSI